MTASAPTRILLAIASPGLLRVIEHLLRELPGVSITTCRSGAAVADACRDAPDVIVTSTRLLGSRCLSVAELRNLCPHAKLVFITDGQEWWAEDVRRGSADASLEEEDLVTGLVPIVHALSAH